MPSSAAAEPSTISPQSFSAPARVNLLGEHTDYTGGLVLPMAIPFYTTVTIRPADSAASIFRSRNLPGQREVAAHATDPASGDWSDYPVGVMRQLEALGLSLPPFILELGGNVPLGAGLSSSASVEVASALAMLSLTDAQLSPEQIALLCQRAENDYVGSPCGIMDQFAVTAAQAGHALLLRTRSLEYENIPMQRGEMAKMRIVICNSLVKHSVATGEYGTRRREVEAGQQVLRETFTDLSDLGQASMEQLLLCQNKMPPASFLRCRHILTENLRVTAAKQAMLAGDAETLGKLMLLAHTSQRDDFACSCQEIDFLVETAAALPGCLGARLTGGGFGGCTVNLVHTDAVDSFQQALRQAYFTRFQIHPDLYICEAVDGAIRTRAAALQAGVA